MKSIGYQYLYFYQFHLLICAADKNRLKIRTTKSFFFFFCSGYYRQQLVWVFLLLSLFLFVLWQVSIFRHFSHSSCHYSHLHPTNIYTSKQYKVYLDIYCQAHSRAYIYASMIIQWSNTETVQSISWKGIK
jgi:hypothetical protein